VRDPCKHN